MQDEHLSPPRGGACATKPTSIFFPDPRTRGITPEMREAIDTCTGCIVRLPCFKYALHHEIHGIWGGLTEAQRENMRRQLKITVSVPGYVDPAGTRIKR